MQHRTEAFIKAGKQVRRDEEGIGADMLPADTIIGLAENMVSDSECITGDFSCHGITPEEEALREAASEAMSACRNLLDIARRTYNQGEGYDL